MKTFKTFLVLISLYSIVWAQTEAQIKDIKTVNGWNFISGVVILDSVATYSKFSSSSNSQIFNIGGNTINGNAGHPEFPESWLTGAEVAKDFRFPFYTLDTVFLYVKLLAQKGDIKEIEVFLGLQNDKKAWFTAGQIISFDGSWIKLKFSMKDVKDFGLLNFSRIYLGFRIKTKSSCYAFISVEVKNLTGVSTDGYSVIYDKFGDNTDVPKMEQVPTKFVLYQNYPNPFNPTTKIKFSVPTSSQVNLKVYDVLGKEVATLVNEYKITGDYEVQFNASNLPSGVYMYKLQTSSFIQTKKMLFLK